MKLSNEQFKNLDEVSLRQEKQWKFPELGKLEKETEDQYG